MPGEITREDLDHFERTLEALALEMKVGDAEMFNLLAIHGACVTAAVDKERERHAQLREAVMGDIPEQPQLWRINWLKSLIDAIDQGDLAITDKCDDPDAMWDCINECRKMVRDVNEALSTN